MKSLSLALTRSKMLSMGRHNAIWNCYSYGSTLRSISRRHSEACCSRRKINPALQILTESMIHSHRQVEAASETRGSRSTTSLAHAVALIFRLRKQPRNYIHYIHRFLPRKPMIGGPPRGTRTRSTPNIFRYRGKTSVILLCLGAHVV